MSYKMFFGITILLFLVVGCSSANEEVCEESSRFEDCMIGCFGGMTYNGTQFVEINEDKISDQQLQEFEACQTLCSALVDL